MVKEVDPALADTNVGEALRLKEPPLPSVRTSDKLRPVRLTFPVFRIMIV